MADTLHAGSVRIGSADRTLVAEKLVAHYQAGRLPQEANEILNAAELAAEGVTE